ncbi:ABC transporter ATP-binding protein [Bradyrhizobium sp. dw_411]|uniref:ABC transporter ATP-binding protein n=1 Tax=Bradyrhizobium sp. dw_411 TaxID=2720082 RepID=UPI001BCB593A|nr:ABC transporter ATP-binding protein [Bradyrhizobium sp. dw_411]
MSNLLEATDINAGYGEMQILKHVNFVIREGAITAVIGSNGAGKTTLMRALSGLIALQSGAIHFDGQMIGKLPAYERLDIGLALVPEGRLVFPDFTVHETLRVGAFARRAHAGWKARRDQMYALFPRLLQRRSSRAGSLSGGEQQMLALARGLMSMPKLLLLDEPSLGLAPMMADEVFSQLRAIRDQGITICIVEQNVQAALGLADYGYVFEDGQVRMEGPAADLLGLGSIRESYLGL